MISESAAQIIQVKEQLIGAVREARPRPLLFADILQSAAYQRSIPANLLKVEIDPAAAYVIADGTQLTRAIGNILQNAVEAGANSVKVTARPSAERGILEILVKDDGAGMPQDVVEKAFSPFFSTRGLPHHGLGLPAAMHVITQSQGRIELVSNEGEGTTVALHIPGKRVEMEAPYAGSVQNILLIDDNDDWADLFAKIIKGTKVKLTQSTSLKDFPVADLILVDENIGSIPLTDTLSALSAAGLASKTVILTSAINPERVTQFLREGVKDVTLKPYSGAEVTELLK